MIRISFIVLIMVSIGCAGPTKTGKVARAKAHQRMDVVNAELAAQQAKQQFEVGQLEDALETIDAAIARYQENGEYHLLRGRILLEQHKLDSALHAFQEVTQYSPELAEPHYFMGVLYQRCSEDVLALREYQRAMDLDSSHPQYVLATAESLVATKNVEEAIDLLSSSSKEFSHQPAFRALLGHIYVQKGEYKIGANHLSDSILLGNDDIETLTSLATAEYHAGSYANCLVTLGHIEQAGTLSPFLTRMLAKCLVATGRIVQGRDLCLQVTRLTPEDSGCWIDLGYIAWEMGDYERLDTCGKRIEQLNSHLEEGDLFQGIAAIHCGNQEEAVEKLSLLRSYNTNGALEALVASVKGKMQKLG